MHQCKMVRGQLPQDVSHGWQAWEMSRSCVSWVDFRAFWESHEPEKFSVTPGEWNKERKVMSKYLRVYYCQQKKGHHVDQTMTRKSRASCPGNFIWSTPLACRLQALWVCARRKNWLGTQILHFQEVQPQSFIGARQLEASLFSTALQKFSQKIKCSAII